MMEGKTLADRYRIEAFIGEGGMSLVYRALDIRTGHNVAVKILKSEFNSDKEFLERFQREAQAASLMSHHNLVNLLDVGVENECRYLVLEYVSGHTLKEIIQQKGRLPYQTAIQITIRILSALQHAHDNGIIHRDIKPQNVLIRSDGHVKVADFGIARMAGGGTIGKGDTVVGSVHYSSPEQARGNPVEATSDLYSTGVVMYEMLTGKLPFVGDNPVSVAMQHIQAIPPRIEEIAPDVPAPVTAVVMKAMEKDPKKRYQSAREMAEALQKAKDGKGEYPAPSGKKDPIEASLLSEESEEDPSKEDKRKAQAGKQQSGQHSRRAIWTAVISSVLVMIFIALGIIYIIDTVNQSAVAPEVIGLSAEDAQSEIRKNGLNIQEQKINSDTVAAGYIIEQYPKAETSMKKGDTLVITVSLGPVVSAMPDVVGLSKEDAVARLKDRNFTISFEKKQSSTAVGTVIGQSPAAETPFTVGQDVTLTISGGSTMVPDLSGLKRAEAAAKLSESSLTLGECSEVETADPEKVGTILSQTPSSGTMAILDSSVSVTIAVESKPYSAILEIRFEPAETDRVLRVTFLSEERETIQYEGLIAAGSDETQTITLYSGTEGEKLCRIYLDGEAIAERTVLLQ